MEKRFSKLGFEIKTCGRCGGTGKHSFCERYRDVCFGCHGSGVTYTKAGKATFLAYEASLKVPAREIKVGDLIQVDSFTMGGDGFRYFAKVTAISEPKVTGQWRNGDGAWNDSIGITINTESEKFGKSDLTCGLDHPVRKGWSAAEKNAAAAKAIAEHQTTKKKGKA